MDITNANLSAFFIGLSTAYNKAFDSAPTHYKDLCTITESTAKAENYGWLDDLPQLREWIGSRVIKELSSQRYVIENKTWESTIGIDREDIEDDQYGIYTPRLAQMAANAASHPDELMFAMLAQGFSTRCYDGQYFFDTDHPVTLDANNNAVVAASNVQQGTGAPWFLLDCSKPIRPMIFQNRRKPELTTLTKPTDPNVFLLKQYLYGVSARYNAGFGLWQLAYGSQQPLTQRNYAAARAAMMSQVSDSGRPLNIKPTHLVTVPALEGTSNALLKNNLISVLNADGVTYNSVSNEWVGTAEGIVTQYLLGGAPAAQLAAWSTIQAASPSAGTTAAASN